MLSKYSPERVLKQDFSPVLGALGPMCATVRSMKGQCTALAEVGGHLRDEIGYEPAVHESMENYIPVKSMA